jgi:hypothetical protein
MDKNKSVRNDEELYRSVRGELKAEEYIIENGKLRIRQNAFRDGKKEPSVDRAELNQSNPCLSKKSDTDGIVSLMTAEVRDIGTVTTSVVVHTVDVTYDPYPKSDPKNCAHSYISVDPDFCDPIFDTNSKRDRTFERLKVALARLATKNGWTLEPSEQIN